MMAIDLERPTDDVAPPILEMEAAPSPWNSLKQFLAPFASLRLTVVLFALSIILILAGTFAQVDKDIWEVVGQYFRCWFAWISFPIFFPPSFVPEMPSNPDEVTAFGRFGMTVMQGLKHLAERAGGVWFPGGKLIGLLLAVNLFSAHVVRFKAVATGARLFAGLVAIAAGCGVTYFIIAAAGSSQAFQTDPWIPYRTVWVGFEGLMAFACLGCIYATAMLLRLAPIRKMKPGQIVLAILTANTAVGLAVLLGWLLTVGEAGRPADASLRILWQLAQGGAAGICLLAGCFVVFGKRAGIVLLHSGIGLMMYYELHVALTAVEMQMNLQEGETSNFASDIRTFELAIVDKSKPGQDHVTTIPRSMIAAGKSFVGLKDVPFDIEVKELIANSHLRNAVKGDKNPATNGIGKEVIAEPVTPGSGTDAMSKIDMPAAYVTVIDRENARPLGTYLLGLQLAMSDEIDTIQMNGKTYELSLRPKRYYKSYNFTLKDVRAENYLGTKTARHYASTVFVNDPIRSVEHQEKTIWMNNPLRFADETFYQSNYARDQAGNEHTTLSVVANTGWMMPYVACMLVLIGMLAHFLTLLIRFLMRSDTFEPSLKATLLAEKLGIKRVTKMPKSDAPEPGAPAADWSSTAALAIVVVVSVYIAAAAMPPAQKLLDYDLYRFGQIPVVQDGRVKPLDSAAYAALLEISGRSYVEVHQGDVKQKLPAIQWLLDVIAELPVADDYEVFRVENLEVQETIGVKKREGMRYSRNEIRKHEKEFRKQAATAIAVSKKDRRQLSVYQRKLLELNEKLSTFDNLQLAFGLHQRIRQGKTPEETIEMFQMARQFAKMLADEGQPIFAIGPIEEGQKWQIFSGAWLESVFERVRNKKQSNPAIEAWDTILKTYEDSKREVTKEGDKPKQRPQDFNQAVDAYLAQLEKNPPRDTDLGKVRFEAFFNHFRPFTHADALYVVALVLGACGWLQWSRGFNRMTFWMLCVVFVLHTFALCSRIYISGRPPVTNLYSSAVFIGWGCVALGLILELVYRLGIGNLIASVAGWATLLIADGLSLGGDTFTVLQAVLDTQFWLATHVTTITLGYATTYLAGMLGLVYVLRGVFTPSLTPEIGRDLNRMIYGTLCFSIFFSFVGTVLGGLWADDSWGRFWGWDPKENGALIIVLWNALVLHARWGGMVKERGLAVLAIAGNIFVSWSWWGVNELGAGLHSYGFTEGTVIRLGMFVLSQLILIGIGLTPKQYWMSTRSRQIV